MNSKTTDTLRWVCVLPSAWLGSVVIQRLIGLIARLLITPGHQPDAQAAYYLQLFLFYAPKEAAFVIAGAIMAPRFHLATAVVLSVTGILLSIVIHILGQTNPGIVNFTHSGLETTGIVLGAGWVFYHEKLRRTLTGKSDSR